MTATDHALELVHAAARAASDKLAQQIVAFDVSEQLAITDAFLLASATNDRQVKAIVDEVEDKLREIGAKPIRREGERDGRWVLESGFSAMWGSLTFPLAAYASALFVAGVDVAGMALTAAALGLVPWVAWRVVTLWGSGRLAVVTNAAEA